MSNNNTHEVVLTSLQSEPRMKFDLLAKGKRPEKESDPFPNKDSQFLLRKIHMNNQRRVMVTELTVPRDVAIQLVEGIQKMLRETNEPVATTAIRGAARAGG